MKYRTTTAVILILMSLPCLGFSQYIRFTKQNNGTNTIVVPAGEAWQLVTLSTYTGGSGGSTSADVLSVDSYSSSENYLGQISDTRGLVVGLEGAASNQTPSSSVGSIFIGPSYIKVNSFNVSNGWYTFVFKKLVNTASNSVSATSVVIPTSASGDVDVKLEQSADNVTWTECLPGTYNSSTVKRFFRLRAVEK